MGFILDGLDTEAYDRTYSDWELFRRIMSYFQVHTRKMGLAAGAISLNGLASVGSPIVIAYALDIVAENPTQGTILLMVGLVLMFGSLSWVFNFVQQYFSARVVGDVVLQLREDAFNATIAHDLSFFDEYASGKIVSRITSDTQAFADVVTLIANLISQILVIVLVTIWLFTVNVSLTLLLLLFTPLTIIVALSFRRIARRVTLAARQVTATINGQIQESVSGITVAKSFRQEPAIYDTFIKNNKLGFRVGLRRGIVLNTIFPVLGATSGVAVAILIYAGGLSIRGELVTPGEWFLFMQAVNLFWFPLISIASFWSQFQDGLSASERVFALIDADPKVRQIGSQAVELSGEIEFRNVHFSYTDKEIVLPDYSLTIAPRETIALVGHTGAGKSSIIKLVTRFYEFQGGELLIDGHDIRTLDLSAYRQHIGLVSQTPFLFSGTVADNICYGKPGATQADIEAAAMRISQGDWVADLPEGLQTDVGERGSRLSLGQRQLVALARVMLKDPSIFILDEATASVDPFTEAQIQEGLDAVMKDRTGIVIAHRLSTIRNVDRIIVMDHGRIVEEGNHESLLAQGGQYANLYNTYFRHQSLEAINNPVWRSEPVQEVS